MSDWECVIGLEIHAQLKTKSKIFSSDSTSFGGKDNEHANAITLGMPGTLPCLNHSVVEQAILTGLALNCKINPTSVFARKHYFYPDLPKGYQISQQDLPICSDGKLEFFLDGKKIKVHIERAHLEEDAGKSLHQGGQTFVNYNRAGVPLLEIVSAPDLRSPKEAAQYARAIKSILEYIETCDGNLEEGSLRCDCNISVRKMGDTKLGTRVELKNLNSFRFIEKALEYEKERQIEQISSGKAIFQETRLYDSTKNQTFSMRAKEESQDYRYFPDPDLLPLEVSSDWVKSVQSQLPELPLQKAERFKNDYGLPEYDCGVLTQEKPLADFFEEVVSVCKNPKASANWIMGDFLSQLNEEKKSTANAPLSSKQLGEMISLIDKNVISGKMAKKVFEKMWGSGEAPEDIVKKEGWIQITDEAALTKMILEILENNKAQVEQYRSGKTKLFGFFVGAVMKASQGQANPELVNKILKAHL